MVHKNDVPPPAEANAYEGGAHWHDRFQRTRQLKGRTIVYIQLQLRLDEGRSVLAKLGLALNLGLEGLPCARSAARLDARAGV